jgi:hypothetical protein
MVTDFSAPGYGFESTWGQIQWYLAAFSGVTLAFILLLASSMFAASPPRFAD